MLLEHVPKFVWITTAILIWVLIILVVVLIFKIPNAKHVKIGISGCVIELDSLSETIKSIKKTHIEIEKAYKNRSTAMEACSYNSTAKQHQQMTYEIKKDKPIILLLQTERKELEKADEQLQKLKAQLQAKR